MNNKIRALLVLAVLLAATLACNFPNQAGQTTAIPAPNQTLTALFAVTPAATETPTLPSVVTATSAAPAEATSLPAAATNTPASSNPTATQAQVSVPTATLRPQATATIPSARPRSAVDAKFLNTAPTIDGDWSEWKDVTTEYPANTVVWGSRSNQDDLAASYHVGWDENYLYIAVKVRDDKYVQNAKGADIYKGDSIEILLDTNLRADFYYDQLSPDDFQMGINPGRPDPDGTREAYLWFPSRIAGSRSNVKIASVKEDGVYRVEAAIPWSNFEMDPVSGAHYGFALSVSDNDDEGSNVQQAMVSNVSTRNLGDPTTWGDLHLVK